MEQLDQGSDRLLPLDRIHEIEIEKLIDAVISAQNLRAQIDIFFVTISVAALGVALNSQRALPVFLSVVAPIAAIVVDMAQRINLAGLYRGLLDLRDRFAPRETTLEIVLPGVTSLWAAEMRSSTRVRRHPILGFVPLRSLRLQSLQGFWLPLVLALGEVVLGLVLLHKFDWPLI